MPGRGSRSGAAGPDCSPSLRQSNTPQQASEVREAGIPAAAEHEGACCAAVSAYELCPAAACMGCRTAWSLLPRIMAGAGAGSSSAKPSSPPLSSLASGAPSASGTRLFVSAPACKQPPPLSAASWLEQGGGSHVLHFKRAWH